MKNKVVFFSLCFLAFALVLFGACRGEIVMVAEKGRAICLSCIGIG